MRPLFVALLVLSACPAFADTVLVIGDSHTDGAFGRALDDGLRSKERVATYGVCNARPSSYIDETPHHCGHMFRDFQKKEPAKWLGGRLWKGLIKVKGKETHVTWVKTPALDQLLSDHTPDYVVVALGTNPIDGQGIDDIKAKIAAAGKSCVWVGPPTTTSPTPKQTAAVYKLLRAHGVVENAVPYEAKNGSCFLVDSASFTTYSGPDGTHYDEKAGAAWGAETAKRILAWIP